MGSLAIELFSQQEQTMSTVEIAKLTRKRHDNVMRDTSKMLKELGLLKNEATYLNEQNKQTYPCFRLNKEETLCLISGYNTNLRMKIIKRWEELESAAASPKIPTHAEALRLAADLIEKVQEQQQIIFEQQKSVELVDSLVKTNSTKSIRETAKILGVKEKTFINDMIDKKIMFRQSGSLLPMAEYQRRGLFEVKMGKGNDHTYHQTRFTADGIAWAFERIQKSKLN